MENPCQIEEEKILKLLDNNAPEEAVDYIMSLHKGERSDDINIKLLSINFLNFIADKYFAQSENEMNFIKALSKSEKLIKELKSYKAKELAFMLRNFEADLHSSRFAQKLKKGDDIKDVLKKHLQYAISNYWRNLKECTDKNESYNIRNNLARCLGFAGRFIEAISLFQENINSDPERFQSIASWADTMQNLKDYSLFPDIPSFYFVIAEKYLSAQKLVKDQFVKDELQKSIDKCKQHLNSLGYELSISNLKENRLTEKEEFKEFSEYRQYVLSNGLSLNEHSLHCFCANAEKDDLSIGLYSGSIHVKNRNNLIELERYLNRLKSEFLFARLLFYKYEFFDDFSGVSYDQDDFTNAAHQEDEEQLGYRIEHIRTSYRILYGLLDKIASAILLHYNISEGNKAVYFEDVFSQFENELSDKDNIHLIALQSLSLDLSQSTDGLKVGSLGFYKKIRNKMEHGLLILTDKDTDPSMKEINLVDFRQFLLELMRLSRSAIFSLNYLIRTDSYIGDLK